MYYNLSKCKNEPVDLYLLNCCKSSLCGGMTGDIRKKSIGKLVEHPKKTKKNITLNIGDIYKLKDLEYNEIIIVTFVEEKNKDEFNYKLSINSPIGDAIQNATDSVIEVKVGNNIIKYKILTKI